jgi:hypothetical protein
MSFFNKGTVLAGAVAAMFACGGGSGDTTTTPASTAPAGVEGAEAGAEHGDHHAPATAEQVKCAGVNECKASADCHGEGNSCKGQNQCKGKGWVMASADDCAGQGGTIVQ